MLAVEGAVHLKELNPHFLPLPKYVSQISPGPNYDYYSSTMRFTISSPVAWLLALVILPARSNMMICVGLITYLALVSVLIT
ncbi:protein ABCI12, chloroplastic-like [Camellia sinensis]|uniref:protein ABCI12, chloroplastic-like n=1 Tax=Camellia sinensis TaxID=4442 RepID=UPI001035794F|nr:protein ABCI12, chloroplastic-like [Camellia sinensis]